MNPLNDLAIIITDLIASDLTREFIRSESKAPSPSYFHIRRTILDTLHKYFKVSYAEHHHQDMEIYSNITPNELSRMTLGKAKHLLMDELFTNQFIYHERCRREFYQVDRFAVAALNIKAIEIDVEKVDWSKK